MRLLFVTQYFEPETYPSTDCVRGLAELGHEVTVLTGLPNYPSGRIQRPFSLWGPYSGTFGDTRIVRVPLFPRRDGHASAIAANYISFALSACLFGLPRTGVRYDAIFVCQGSPILIATPALLAKWISRRPIIMWVLDLWPESALESRIAAKSLLGRLISRVSLAIYRRCDSLLVSSRGFERPLRERGVAANITYWPQWSTTDGAQSPGNSVDLGIAGGFKIVFAGNVGEAQNLGLLLDAAELTRDKPISWIIAGDGSRFKWLQTEVKSRNLSHSIVLLGRLPESAMQSLYAQSDVLLALLDSRPTNALTLPRKVVGYLAAAKPILAAATGETTDVLERARAGISCSPASADELARAACDLLEMPEQERAAMGRRGQSYCRDNFSRQTRLEQLDAILESLSPNSEHKTRPARDAKASNTRIL